MENVDEEVLHSSDQELEQKNEKLEIEVFLNETKKKVVPDKKAAKNKQKKGKK